MNTAAHFNIDPAPLDRAIDPHTRTVLDLLLYFRIPTRIVGGAVRDLLLGKEPRDIDLVADADPAVLIYLFEGHGIPVDLGGIQHGTVKAVFGHGDSKEKVDVSSLGYRIQRHGHHFEAGGTHSWRVDSELRDLTINSMSMSLAGELYDPFGGFRDLQAGVVRFVGDPAQRIQEDYLRILRLYRFTGRFGKEVDEDARRAVAKHRAGLDSISVERVWSEMRRIISGPQGPHMVNELYDNLWGIKVIGDKWPTCEDMEEVHARTRNPVALMAVGWVDFAPSRLAEWKASREEIDMCSYLSNYLVHAGACQNDPFREMAVNNISREWALELAAIQNINPLEMAMLASWQVPVFPINGNDLIAQGAQPGKLLGSMLKQAKNHWADSNFQSSKQDLLDWVITEFDIKQE